MQTDVKVWSRNATELSTVQTDKELRDTPQTAVEMSVLLSTTHYSEEFIMRAASRPGAVAGIRATEWQQI